MDPALKKRMIGATVLIVLAIIFVPMVFTGRPHERLESVDLGLPDQPARDLTTQSIPLAPAPRPAPPEDQVATVDTAKSTPPPPADALSGDAKPASATAAPAAATKTPDPAPAKPATTPAPAAPEPTSTAAAPAPAEDDPKPTAHGRYLVNYGTYTKPENVAKLVADLKRAGVAAYDEGTTYNGQPARRVRSGPYVDRSQADKARLIARQARNDVTGTVAVIDDSAAGAPSATPAPDAKGAASPAAAVPAAATPATAITGWAVQIAAYRSEADATQKRDQLRKGGFSAFVESVKTDKGTLYRLRVGPSADRAGADRLRAELKEKMRLDGTVVQQP